MTGRLVEPSEALKILQNEGLVAIPTETVYGLAGRIDSAKALRSIFEIKGRPFFDPLIVHVASTDQARTLVSSWPKIANFLADKFWPGPLTLVLPKSPIVSELITSGLETVAIRCPRHPLCLNLIKALGTPLAAPSANRFGHTSPTSAQHVLNEFNDEIAVLDGGECEIGLESTVLQVDQDRVRILRPGGITRDEIRRCLAKEFPSFTVELAESSASPGHLKHHYQPKVPLVWVQIHEGHSTLPTLSEKLLLQAAQFLKLPPTAKGRAVGLSDQAPLAARQFYSELRKAAESRADFLYLAIAKRNSAEWEALQDRLKRAATLILDETGKILSD